MNSLPTPTSRDGWLRTGDKGTFDATGNLKITGRVKDPFKTSKGRYVAPAPIEDKLVMHDAVEACCETGAGLGQPIALLMLNELACRNAKVSANRVNLEVSLGKHFESINSMLEPHEKLHCLVALTEPWNVNNGMVTPTLKVKRNRIEESFDKYFETWTSVSKPVVWHEQYSSPRLRAFGRINYIAKQREYLCQSNYHASRRGKPGSSSLCCISL